MIEQVFAMTRHGILHVYPSPEQCNLDDSREHVLFFVLDEARKDESYRRDCRRCFRAQ